ncbi:cryptochrome/photolyase family protein [Cellulophaga sp. HaHaR_3_176]|uniref:cryptochrome/photolyase family protein n=1 Tax=Cellulophaga sp. HaHaR_3_176 TaxID=1942464 RepID=UPI001C1F206D|nr:cryptochrome/photolyase family protein [Cellulophaga sp. HaHaR_3_176]QWX84955.1 cryptochrome/photolyase family protein [Cellulophaga sp. HaHaR_3_176]
MKKAVLIFPHQLFKDSPLLNSDADFYIIEEFLFFNQFKFHKHKIAYHRATMKSYADYLKNKGCSVIYIEAIDKTSDIRKLLPTLSTYEEINYIDVTDNWLQKRIEQTAEKIGLKKTILPSPLFLNTKKDLEHFFKEDKKNFHQTTFYKQERKKRGILLDMNDKPVGEKWSFDAENRKKYPAKKIPPSIQYPDKNKYYKEAFSYVDKHFFKNYGELLTDYCYPIDFKTAEAWLQQFLEQRFLEFGTYEDAIVAEHSILNHSVLTPMLNVGLLTPKYVIDTALNFANENDIPINSTEGFIRQIIGWREFMRGMYELKGTQQRTENYWKFKNKIPTSFYTGTTGIPPIDNCIKKVLKTGYCHHIERLMVLGNFMLLCEFDPDEVYQWFMELFIDAYDWVMVPNIYGMSQFADGGLLATKPYISGSNYLMKMSNYKKGDWQETWDGLFWNFMDKQRDFFSSNPRLSMLLSTFDKMSKEKQEMHLTNAEKYLNSIRN